MAAPKTNGILRATLKDMKIGDYCKYEMIGVPGVGLKFQPYVDASTEMTSGYCFVNFDDYVSGSMKTFFYFIKVDYGLAMSTIAALYSASKRDVNKYNLLYGLKSTDGALIRTPSSDELIKYMLNNDLNGNIVENDTAVWSDNMLINHIIQNLNSHLLIKGDTSDLLVGNYTGDASVLRLTVEFVDNDKSTNVFY